MTKTTARISADIQDRSIRRLAASVCLRALADLKSADPLTSLDAFMWLTGSDFPLWAEAAGTPFADPLSLLSKGFKRRVKTKGKSKHE